MLRAAKQFRDLVKIFENLKSNLFFLEYHYKKILDCDFQNGFRQLQNQFLEIHKIRK